ncbi:hypothetical protein [Planomicrobium sp. CPCC 101110]|uniref:TcaA 3rd/4th domain-containing protein n=1 Tax=Planomicrobium sp. CPCC 101110 TaxID=2599619 RepID=UPI0011B56509|nr:hypothetical protein [Planomicrobium sp. CPCC 101110]TWT27741.1 hypothetical protein FQV30_04305 [Planomicrobium sp. CPCC 101110]
MNNCRNCGRARTDSNLFCLNCGEKFDDPITSASTNERPKQHSPKNSKIKKAGFVAAAVVLLATVGTHLLLQSKYDASKSIVAMNQAFSQNDADTFFFFFTVPEDAAADEKAFYDFVENEGWESLRDQLQTETALLKNNEMSDVILDSKGNKLISVVSEPVLFGLYDKATFLIHPVTVEAEMPLDKTSVDIGTKTVSGNQGELVSVGEFVPGSYDWKASAESEFSPIKAEGTMDIQGDGSNSYLIDPELEGGMVSITSDVEDAVLWIDGKSTKKTVKEMSLIGPLAFDGSVEISAESKDEKGQVIKGEPVAIETGSAHITFPSVQEKLESDRQETVEEEEFRAFIELHEPNLRDLISSFRYEFESALNYADFSYISSFFPAASPIEAEYIAKMEEHSKLEGYYEYDFTSTVVSDIEVVDEQTFQVITDEVFNYTLDEDEFNYHKTKAYTVEIQIGGGYYITAIKEVTSDYNEL